MRLLRPRTPPRWRRGCGSTWAANSSGKVADGIGRAVSFHSAQDGVALLGRENVEAADRPLRLRHRRLQQPNQPTRQRRNARPVEQVGGVFEHPVDPRRLAVRAALLCEAERQVELGAGSVDRFEATAVSPGSSRLAGALFCSASITWNSGCRDSERAGLSTSTSRSNGKS